MIRHVRVGREMVASRSEIPAPFAWGRRRPAGMAALSSVAGDRCWPPATAHWPPALPDARMAGAGSPGAPYFKPGHYPGKQGRTGTDDLYGIRSDGQGGVDHGRQPGDRPRHGRRARPGGRRRLRLGARRGAERAGGGVAEAARHARRRRRLRTSPTRPRYPPASKTASPGSAASTAVSPTPASWEGRDRSSTSRRTTGGESSGSTSTAPSSPSRRRPNT